MDVAGLREDPDGGLLVADAAVAIGQLLDLGQGDLVDEGRAVAVAAVGLEWCLLLSHFSFLFLIYRGRINMEDDDEED